MSKPFGNDWKVLNSIPKDITVKAGADIWDTEAEEWKTPEEDWDVKVTRIFRADELEVGLSGWNGNVLFHDFTKEMWKKFRHHFGVRVALSDLWSHMRDDGTHVYVVFAEPEVEFLGPDGRTYTVEVPVLLDLP